MIYPGTPCAVLDLLGGESVEVEVRLGLLHGSADLNVEVPRHIRGQPCLYADFGRSQASSFRGTADDFVDWKIVGFVGTVGPAEGAESASFDAHVGEIDVAIDDVGDLISDCFPA